MNDSAASPGTADASPTKDFFVDMLTRDISIEDCILDLVDNCLDGARRKSRAGPETSGEDSGPRYRGSYAKLTISRDRFEIRDNCGGISIDKAKDYAFHFGKPRGPSPHDDSLIGLYGIGMKRAILKLGRKIDIHSSTSDEAFRCAIDVDSWVSHDKWEFELLAAETIDGTGTIITVTNLREGISEAFADETFLDQLRRTLARDYSRFIQHGFVIKLNGTDVEGKNYEVRESDEFKPFRTSYTDQPSGVRVDIVAGMGSVPPDEAEPEEDRTDVSGFGWFVLCNDRVVLAADKTSRTVWGDEDFARWHSQYNGFVGLVLFESDDPKLLPWTTTKREVDADSALFRRTVARMKDATRPWTAYTRLRKADLERAKEVERQTRPVAAFTIAEHPQFTLPVSREPAVKMATIRYRKPKTDVTKVAAALGDSRLSGKSVGEQTFEYFVDNEIED